MTSREEFWAALRATPRAWRVCEEGHLRLTLGTVEHCPLTAVATLAMEAEPDPCDPPIRGPESWEDAMEVLDLPRDFGCRVVEAADREPWADSTMREALLLCCGIGGRP